MVVFQKLEGKTTTLNFWNQKLEGKTTTLNFWNQKLEGKPTTLKNWIQKMEGNSTTPKNCVLISFLNERSTIFFPVLSLVWFWILLRNDNCYFFYLILKRCSKNFHFAPKPHNWKYFDAQCSVSICVSTICAFDFFVRYAPKLHQM